MKRRYLIISMVLNLSLAAAATTVVPMSIERLTRASSYVVRARAVHSWSAWDASQSRIFTYTRFESVKRLKGQLPSSFVVKQLGGSAGGYTQHVAGVRRFTAGEESLLFLHTSEARDGTFVVTGLVQGDFRITRSSDGEAMVSNGVGSVDSFDPRTSRIGPYAGTRMRLADVEARVMAVQP